MSGPKPVPVLERDSGRLFHELMDDSAATYESEPRTSFQQWILYSPTNALRNQPDILFRNERSIQVLDTNNFGCVASVEVGALSVGRVVQEHDIKKPFRRGDRKAVFRFGGSAVVLYGERGKWRLADDLLRMMAQGTETFVRLGEPIADKL